MKKFLIFSTFSLLFLLACEIKAQQLVVRYDEPFVTNSLSGIVTDPKGDIIAGVLVKRCNSDWKKTISTTSTNEKGKFNFSKLPDGLYFLKLIYNGFQQTEVKIRIYKKSKKKLIIRMELAT